MQYLVATDSVHTTAVACDYLEEHAAPDATVTVVTVTEPGQEDRDSMDAINVARARLAAVAAVETDRRDGDPAVEILAAAEETGADIVVIGRQAGRRGTRALGETARQVIAGAAVPVVVVPRPTVD